MKRHIVILFLTLVFLLPACREKPRPVVVSSDSELKEGLEKANRYLVNDEEEDIENFVRRHQWEMVSTGTGMRYQVVKAGDGPVIQPGQTVTMEYVLYDIFGDVVYTSENDGLIKFVVGHGGVVTGVDEAVRHLHQGDVARVVVPSHLGYGLVGDQKRIPGRATLIYTLIIKEVQ